MTKLRPPRGFKEVRKLRCARLCASGPFERAKGKAEVGYSTSQLAGVRYERAVQKVLLSLLGPLYHPGQWIKIEDEWGSRYVQPDGFAELPQVVLVEVKLTHTPNAWWQLRRAYQPVLEHIYERPVKVCEVVKNYVPATLPEPEELLLSTGEFRDFVLDPEDRYGVFRIKAPTELRV